MMATKRKDKEKDKNTPVKSKRNKKEKNGDFSDDEDLSDIDDGGEIFNGIRIPAELPPIISAEENPGPRMVIKNIVANNFKSYYGEVTVGPFHKSLTSIVGANGSGKSNVIDSLLFVFGYRSTKIRSKKVSVLLHKSDQHKDVRQCSVTVNFVLIQDDNTQSSDFISIPGTEITITRTAFKDNTSYYTLNNKRVKFKDVATILKKNGIDLIHNRFLILQGEVEQIAMMKPKAENEHSTGMLEYLEDVIGTVRYKIPIEKLDEKVKEVSLEKNEKVARLKFFAKEREELIEPAEEVIRFLKRSNDQTQWKNRHIQKLIYDENKIIETKTEAQNDIKQKTCSIENELQAIADSKKKNDGVLKNLSEKLKLDAKKKDNLEIKLKNLIVDNSQLKADITQTNEQIKKCENSIKQENKKITKAKGVPKIKEAEYEQLNSQLKPLEEECIQLEENYTKVNKNGYEKSKKFREEKDVLAPEELKLQKIVGSKQNQFQTLKTEFEVLIDNEKSEREKLNKLEEQLFKEVNEFQRNTKQKEKAESDINISKDKIKDLERNVRKLINDKQQIETNLQNMRQSLTEKRTAYAETTERSRPIQYILKLKDKKKIRGILGRCGDYGQVESKYDIPTSTSCGTTDQIVVETSDVAHACIHELRINNIGRLTFSIIPQIARLQKRADTIHVYPQNAKRVFDFIQVLDERFRLTFYAGLHETLLAENLIQARQIAFGGKTRHRVVTYKGELIEVSGIMSGGGKPIKGKIGPQETMSRCAGNTVSQNEVEKLDKIANDLEMKLIETQSNIDDFQANINKLNGQIEELYLIVRQCSSRINAFKEKESQVKNLIETQKLLIVKKKADPIAVANKEAEIKNAEIELEKAKIEFNKINSKMDNLNKNIKEITEGEPKEAKRLLDEATKKLEKTRSGLNQVNVDIHAAERQLKKSEGQIITLNDDIIAFKEKIESFNEKLKKNEDLSKGLKEKINEMSASIIEQRTNIQEIENKKDENQHKSIELRKDKIQLSQELIIITNELSKNLMNIDNLKIELSNLKLHTIPELNVVHRDPVLESYQNRGLSQNTNENEKNKNKDSEKNDNSKENDDSNQMDVDNVDGIDDNIDLDAKVLPEYPSEQLEKFSLTRILWHCSTFEKHSKENINLSILEEYQRRTKQYNEKADEVAKVLKIYNDHVDMLNKVRQRRKDEFMASFKKITIKLKEMYQMITLGGDAELELVDSLDPFSEGVNFSVRPPKKTWKVISNLSGGEKTLSSLALVFALHYYKPSPLYVMDEIDAALDFKNVSIIAYYIKERTKNSQFIIISLRSNMFEKANLLVGIYKTNDCTATTSILTNKYLNAMKSGVLCQYVV